MGSENDRSDLIAEIGHIMPGLNNWGLGRLAAWARALAKTAARDLSSEALAAEQKAREAEAGSQALTLEEEREAHRFGQVTGIGFAAGKRAIEESKRRIHERVTAAVAEPGEAQDPRPYQPKRGDWVQVKHDWRQDRGCTKSRRGEREGYNRDIGVVGKADEGFHCVTFRGHEVWYHLSELSPLDPAVHVPDDKGDVEKCLRCGCVVTDRFNGPCEPRPCDQVLLDKAVQRAHELALNTAAKIAEPVDADDRGPRETWGVGRMGMVDSDKFFGQELRVYPKKDDETWGRVNDAAIKTVRALEEFAVAVSRIDFSAESEQGAGYEALSAQVSGIAKTLTAAGYACNGGPISLVVERVLADLKQARKSAEQQQVPCAHRSGGESMPNGCADCGVDWADMPEAEWRGAFEAEKVEGAKERFARCCVAGVVRNAKSQILLIRSKKEGRAWELPGGKIKEGEGWRDAFKREIEEETGLTPRALIFGTVLDGTPKPGAVFTSVILMVHANADGEPKAGDDAAEARWFDVADVPVNELSNLQTSDYLRETVSYELQQAQYARQLKGEGDPLLDRDQEGGAP